MKNLREKVLGTHVKEDSEPPWVHCFLLVEESVADQGCQQVARLHPETS